MSIYGADNIKDQTYPSPDVAYEMMPKTDAETAFVCEPMVAVWNVARHAHDAGYESDAKEAFIMMYEVLRDRALAAGLVHCNWFLSYGDDQELRDRYISDLEEEGLSQRISTPN